MAYHEIEDIGRIAKLGNLLIKAIKAESASSEIRKIGFPSGHTNRKVFFLRDDGAESFWFSSWSADDGSKVINLFGRGESRAGRTMTIDVQFNHGKRDFSRRLGGAFLEDRSTGEVVLAHRGIVTLGHRVKTDILFEAMASAIVEAETSDGLKDFLFMAMLDSPTMVDDLATFSSNLRTTVQNLPIKVNLVDDDGGSGDDGSGGDDEPAPAAPSRGFGKLGSYFSEFSGQRRSFTPRKIYSFCNHGKVVDALEAKFTGLGKTLKSTAVDLAVDRPTTALLFEVKTDAATQSVYTAIGQLNVHAPTVIFVTERKVVSVLVVPERPMEILAKIVEDTLRIRIVTYSLNRDGSVTFDGLDRL